MTDELKDAVTGEELSEYTAQLADGRMVTVNARDEATARAMAREQGGGIGVMSIEGDDVEGDGRDPSAVVEGEARDADGNVIADRDVNRTDPGTSPARADSEHPQDDGSFGLNDSPDGTVNAERAVPGPGAEAPQSRETFTPDGGNDVARDADGNPTDAPATRDADGNLTRPEGAETRETFTPDESR